MTFDSSAAALERHYTSRDAAKLIGFTTGSLRNLRLERKGPRWVTTADGAIRYPESALREYLNGEVHS